MLTVTFAEWQNIFVMLLWENWYMQSIMQEIFKTRFRELVDAKGISKTQCAKEIGISYKTFNDMYEYGKSKRIRILLRLVKYFNVSSDYLLGLKNEKKIKKDAK